MGVKDGALLLRPSSTYTHNLKNIREGLYNDFPKAGPHPKVGVDASIFIVAAISSKGALQELYMEPKVPVYTVSEYVKGYLTLFKEQYFDPILVFDGGRNLLSLCVKVLSIQYCSDLPQA